MSAKKKISGWLTREDIEKLEEADENPPKNKTHHSRFRCDSCSYYWFYETKRCPVCSSSDTHEVE